jgi:acetyl-CoA carboxylase biotin carboxyl carrier protein
MSDEASSSGDVFDVEKVRRIVELMEQHDLTELELRQGDQRIQLKRGAVTVTQVGLPAAPAMAAGQPTAPPATASMSEQAATPEAEGEHVAQIKSPMVGTFFSKPNPEAEPFVEVGDQVDPDTTVCIIEAMKVFNEIPADVSGRIVAVLVENEEPVEFGKPLFKVDTMS